MERERVKSFKKEALFQWVTYYQREHTNQA